MNPNAKVTGDHLKRRAIVYIRQSSPIQVAHNLESQRRQYALAGQARQLGFQQVEVIDEDLGRSGSGQVDRPGFARLVAEVCTGGVGAVFCIEASRLADTLLTANPSASNQSVEKPGPWKPWKTQNRFSTAPPAPWNAEPAGFPLSHRFDDGPYGD